MGLLYKLHNEIDDPNGSPLELWVKKHGKRSLEKFKNYLTEENKYIGPVPFSLKGKNKSFKVFIDPENKYNITDKLSLVSIVDKF